MVGNASLCLMCETQGLAYICQASVFYADGFDVLRKGFCGQDDRTPSR